MKKLLLLTMLTAAFFSTNAQTYNNEWINYSQTYYKFKVGADGVCRISQPALATVGLGNYLAQYFQLWRNGVEVPLYTSVASGALGTNDFIEFYGMMNDGKVDTKLYKIDSLQMNDKWSLYTDTAAYFLTINTASANRRFTDPGNDVAGNILPKENYFIHSLSKYYKLFMNEGYGVDLGEMVHSASYESGEGWSSLPIESNANLTENFSGLLVESTGPPALFKATVAGNYSSGRVVSARLNNTVIASAAANGFDKKQLLSGNIPLSIFSGDAANIVFNHNGINDNVVVSDFQLTYPRKFDFGNQQQFYFEMPAGTARYVEISNFNTGGSIPILYDLANNFRINAVVAGGLVKFVLPSSSVTLKLVLVSTAATAINNVNSFTIRNFTNYGLTVNQGDYLIISHSNLYNDGVGNDNVEKYRQYRLSAAGGNYKAVTFNIDLLTDQFAFGIKHHPFAIRNFAAYALVRFSMTPKFIFLIGKGLKYSEFRSRENDPNVNKLALVPTFGYPASDNLLTATRSGQYPLVPIGRLSAITGAEVGIYLDKVKQFDIVQTTAPQTIAGKGWMKNIAQLTGGLSDPNLSSLIGSYMDNYETIMSDSIFAGNVFNFSKNSGVNTALGTTKTLDQLFNDGLSMLTYFGHSSPNSIEFNLDNPESYNNTGKYPLMIINGCNSGDLFVFDTLRSVNSGTLSEKFIFANQKGAIGYIASTHFGLPTQLNYVNEEICRNLSKTMYGNTIGNIMQTSMKNVIVANANDYIAQTHVEEITLHGDPAIRLNPQSKPDFVIEDSMLSITPASVSVADYTVSIKTKINNIGRAVKDSLTVLIQRKLPDNSLVTLGTYRLHPLLFQDSIVTIINLNPSIDRGTSQIIVTIDPDNLIAEQSETNNTVTKSFTIIEDEIRPVFPYEFAIVNTANPTLYGSSANPLAATKQYVMEMDTTERFNSPSKIVRTQSATGGVIPFSPNIVLRDSTVYYWRVAVGPITANTNWLKSSFVYINGQDTGFNLSHYYQQKKDAYQGIAIDSNSYVFSFVNQTRKLLIRTGLYPYYSWDQINVNIDNEQIDYYGCAYNALQIVVYDPLTLTPWKNYNEGSFGKYGSYPVCSPYPGGYRNFFHFPYDDSAYRRKAMNFFDSIPNGYFVSVTNLGWTGNNSFINVWKADTTRLGSGKSLWHKMQQLGMTQIDSFNKSLPFLFVFKKGSNNSFPVKQTIGPAANSHIVQAYNIDGQQIEGSVTSPWLGPASSWNNFKWNENTLPASSTATSFDIIGQDNVGNETTLATVYHAKDTSISFIDAQQYPFLKMRMNSKDPLKAKCTQLKNWMLTTDGVPEGAVSPNWLFSCNDSLTVNDTLFLKVGFINVSNISFDSIKTRLIITTMDGVDSIYTNRVDKGKWNKLAAGDSTVFEYALPMQHFFGINQLKLEVNPDEDQPELLHFNNFIFKQIYVSNGPFCAGSSFDLVAGDNTPGNRFQWEINSGTGYTSLSDGGAYVGTNGNILTVSAPATSTYGYRCRCRIVTTEDIIKYSPEYIFRFGTKWTGAGNSSWEIPENWDCNVVPDENTDVIIETGVSNFPVIANSIQAVCRSLKAKKESTVQINTGGRLAIKGPPGGR